MEENKKKGKGVKVFLVIFIILFVLAALALGYGYTKYKDLQNEKTNLNTKYESVNKELDKTKSDLDTANENLKESDNKGNIENQNYISYRDNRNISLYAIGYSSSIIAYKGKMYYIHTEGIFSDGSATTIFSETMIKKALKGGKNGFTYKVDTIHEDEESYTELNWKACSKKDSCLNYIYDFSMNESDVNRAVIVHRPGNTDASEYPMIVKKDGTVYGLMYEGSKFEVEKVKLEHNNVDNINITCETNKKQGFGCTSVTYELTLKDGSVVKEIKKTN